MGRIQHNIDTTKAVAKANEYLGGKNRIPHVRDIFLSSIGPIVPEQVAQDIFGGIQMKHLPKALQSCDDRKLAKLAREIVSYGTLPKVPVARPG